jgi:hypothetical protein
MQIKYTNILSFLRVFLHSLAVFRFSFSEENEETTCRLQRTGEQRDNYQLANHNSLVKSIATILKVCLIHYLSSFLTVFLRFPRRCRSHERLESAVEVGSADFARRASLERPPSPADGSTR